MTIMYRGVRLSDFEVNDIEKNGMRYYWEEPDKAVRDIFRALERFNKISKLGNTPLLRDYILEVTRLSRLQIWATDDKDNANSYSRATPEIIFLVLDSVGVERKDVYRYLNYKYGDPYVVKFHADVNANINVVCGKLIEPENIISIEKVNTNEEDPFMKRFRQTVTI